MPAARVKSPERDQYAWHVSNHGNPQAGGASGDPRGNSGVLSENSAANCPGWRLLTVRGARRRIRAFLRSLRPLARRLPRFRRPRPSPDKHRLATNSGQTQTRPEAGALAAGLAGWARIIGNREHRMVAEGCLEC